MWQNIRQPVTLGGSTVGVPLHGFVLGDVIEVTFPSTTRQSLLGMVTRLHRSDMFLTDVVPGLTEPPRESATLWVSRESLQGKKPRHEVRLRKEFAAWRAGGLMSFGAEQPEIPLGLSLDGLLRYSNGKFILANDPPLEEDDTARFNEPFIDHLRDEIVYQHVTVFALNHGATLERINTTDLSGRWRHTLPSNCSYTKVDAGTVLTCRAHNLALGDNVTPGGKLRWHMLFRNQLFAVETALLEMVGIDPDSL